MIRLVCSRMPSRRLFVFAVVLAGLCSSDVAGAQNIAVQQPVMGVNTGGTSVSVPDGGTLRLGGVSGGASGRNSYGGFPGNGSIGTRYSGSSMSATVHIIDLHEMDDAILNSPGAGGFSSSDSRSLNPAYTMSQRWRQPSRLEASATATSGTLPALNSDLEQTNRNKAAVYREKATAARARGQDRVAALYDKLVERYESTRP